jgi:hypothetical protein
LTRTSLVRSLNAAASLSTGRAKLGGSSGTVLMTAPASCAMGA